MKGKIASSYPHTGYVEDVEDKEWQWERSSRASAGITRALALPAGIAVHFHPGIGRRRRRRIVPAPDEYLENGFLSFANPVLESGIFQDCIQRVGFPIVKHAQILAGLECFYGIQHPFQRFRR